MLEHMQKAFDCQLDDLKIFLGPAAKACCYEIKEDVLAKIQRFSYGHQAVVERDGKVFFDVALFNQLQLENAELDTTAFNQRYNLCTICNKTFCSYRRDGVHAQRQLTIASLKYMNN